MIMEPNTYQTMQNFDKFNYQYQYMRNTVQVNQGPSIRSNDSIGNPVFSQVSFLSGVAETDWSWAPLVTDFDNDGLRDIIITNGYPKDITDHDFMNYRAKTSNIATPQEILQQVPTVPLRNYAFRNKGELLFENKTIDWGFDLLSYSNGGAYADLDNDGDMDLIVNNINGEALVYRNNINKEENKHFLNIIFEGADFNKTGFGTWVKIYYDNGKQQVYEHSPYRGYISSLQNMAHFGLGAVTKLDSVVIIWPDHKMQVLKDVNANQLLKVNINNALSIYSFDTPQTATDNLFTDITDTTGIDFTHYEKDFPDFNIQKLLPHKFSEYSPALAAGDIDGNGFDDIVCSGTSQQPAMLFLQQPNGKFIQKKLFQEQPIPEPNNSEEMFMSSVGSTFKDSGILLFDADGDGDLDMYISSGGYLYKAGTDAYQDRFYINDGKGNFTLDKEAIPVNHTSKFCVRAADYDNDGDLDLFIAGRVEPMSYPKPVSSIILRNDSEKGKIKFTDVTKEVAGELINTGLVCDAVFSDFNNDGWPDLIIAGEWMPVSFYQNNKGVFKNIGSGSGINDKTGWWNTIAPGDYDNDGDIDYIVGNLGLNSYYRASEKYPVVVTAKDFDGNGSYDAFLSTYLPSTHEKPEIKLYPAHLRDEVIKQMPGLKSKAQNYKKYAIMTMPEMFTPEQLQGSVQYTANTLTSSYIRNDGGKFTILPLPIQAQMSVPGGMVADDFDNDGNLDLIINGNDFGADVSLGRNDAFNGLFLKGNGKGDFTPLSILQSGIYIPGNGKALVQLRNNKGNYLLAASQNNGPLKIFGSRKNIRSVAFDPGDISAIISFDDGRKQKKERYHGYSFLSQSVPVITIEDKVTSLEITDSKGKTRKKHPR